MATVKYKDPATGEVKTVGLPTVDAYSKSEVDALLENVGTMEDAAKIDFSNVTDPFTAKANLGLSGLRVNRVIIPAGDSVEFEFLGNIFVFGRVTIASLKPCAYVISSYATSRSPGISQLAVGDNLSLISGGDDTNGWYVTIKNSNAGASAELILFSHCSMLNVLSIGDNSIWM